MGANCTYDDVAKMIDHSLLHPTLTDQELAMGCKTALEHNVASVCIIPHYLRRCVEVLAESGVAAGTTIGFPHGGQGVAAKVREAEDAIGAGAQELDIVVNIGKVLGGDWDYVRREITATLRILTKFASVRYAATWVQIS
jgi:deoxyribose-phosphate aldolase